MVLIPITVLTCDFRVMFAPYDISTSGVFRLSLNCNGARSVGILTWDGILKSSQISGTSSQDICIKDIWKLLFNHTTITCIYFSSSSFNCTSSRSEIRFSNCSSINHKQSLMSSQVKHMRSRGGPHFLETCGRSAEPSC